MSDTNHHELFKLRKKIKQLEAVQGNGTSMITLVIPPKESISKSTKLLTDEYGAASNIKSRTNRLSVQTAIRSVQAKLQLIPRVPVNGVAIFCGEAVGSDGKIKKITEAIEPSKSIGFGLEMVDEDDGEFGFINVNGKGVLIATLSGTMKTVLVRYSVQLPKKHSRGGQSALRFSRLRDEARHNYIRKIAEIAGECFVKDNTIGVQGIILAGCADLKTDLQNSELFDRKLRGKILAVVDCEYGGESGFNTAVEASAGVLGNVKLVQEKEILKKYYEDIALDTGKVTYGITDTIKALEMGAVESVIIYEDLEVDVVGRGVVIGDKEMYNTPTIFAVNGSGNMALTEWLVDNHHRFGVQLHFVSDSSAEGSQFVKGLGGIGAFLR
ncbi:eukaryotic peptide chain release factor subunit 1 [Tothia fuscella]|uniref:Eukaryotic peptide chain release factor subunit 1 n=1 Tax=Tothia fuscella TaxID=1048955 RepID=A0A9P4TTF9_9PEZI|nr:eukaryotic peptide chain release factor subunit 1 [Tothia fuscella]